MFDLCVVLSDLVLGFLGFGVVLVLVLVLVFLGGVDLVLVTGSFAHLFVLELRTHLLPDLLLVLDVTHLPVLSLTTQKFDITIKDIYY